MDKSKKIQRDEFLEYKLKKLKEFLAKRMPEEEYYMILDSLFNQFIQLFS